MSTETPAITSQKPLTIRQHLEGDSFRDQVAKALPKHMPADRFLRVAITAMTKTPKLKDCDQASFFLALLTLSQLGLEPDGRRAHLIPFENRKRGIVECQLIIDWKGLSELIYRSGIVSTLHADVVHRGDIFEYSMGQLNNHVPHYLRTDSAKPEEEGPIIAVYSRSVMKDGSAKADVMSRDEVEAIRKRSRSGNSCPWVTDWNEMAKKTVFRRQSKWLPLSAEIRQAVEADDDAIDIQASGPRKSTLADQLAAPSVPFELPAPTGTEEAEEAQA